MIEAGNQGPDAGADRGPVPPMLKVLLRERNWHTFPMFKRAYREAAEDLDKDLVSSCPSNRTFVRWLSGRVDVPRVEHCAVLEAMFPGWTASDLFAPDQTGDDEGPTLFKELLKREYIHTYRMFSKAYDDAARRINSDMAGRGPSERQFYRWLSGEVMTLPYPEHCAVLEAMFPGHAVQQLFQPYEPYESHSRAAIATPVVEAGKPDQQSIAIDVAMSEATPEMKPNPTPLSIVGAGGSGLVTVGPLAAEMMKLAQSTSAPSAIGATEIGDVRLATQLFTDWDALYGGGLVREAVNAQLRYSTELLNADCLDRLRSELYSAVGRLGQAAGFMAFDAYAHDDARRMFRFALACAEESGDWHLRASVLSSMARQAFWLGAPDDGLTYIEFAAVRSDRLTATERAMLSAIRARALAKLGRVQETVAAVGRADEEFAQVETDNAGYSRYYDAAEHAGETGHALADLAIHGQFQGDAEHRLTEAITRHADAYRRSRAFCQITLAEFLMYSDDPVLAAKIGAEALETADKIRSRRVVDNMGELYRLSTRHEQITEVKELRNRIRGAVTTV